MPLVHRQRHLGDCCDTRNVDDVLLGCVTPLGAQGANIGRVAAVVAGYDECVPGKQLNRFCASGLEAVNTAAAHVHAFIFLH